VQQLRKEMINKNELKKLVEDYGGGREKSNEKSQNVL
jgi:hypothetical protein